MEETVQVLFDEGALVRDGNAMRLTRPLGELKIPPTVQGILAARIDRLPADAKELLQTLAIIGREFSLSLIRAMVAKSDDELNRLLNDLQLGEFIYEQPAVGDTKYIFKHALTQEMAYNSVLIERRQQLHGRIGAAIESLYTTLIEDHLDELAHHYGRSGNVRKALEYYERAGRQAAQRSAYTDAIRALSAALELLKRLPESPERDRQELGLQTTLGPVLVITEGWTAPETERVYLRAQELAETGGTAAQRFLLLIGLFGMDFAAGRLPEARERLEQVRTLVSRQPEPEFLLELQHFDWALALSSGELGAAQRHVEDGLAFCQAQPGSVRVTLYTADHPAVCVHAWGAIVFWMRGYPEKARRHLDHAASSAHEIGHSASVIFALVNRAMFHQIAREVTPALEAAEASITMAEEEGVALLDSWARVARGWALAHLRQAEQGVAQIREGLAMTSASGAELWRTYHLAQLAEACGKAGRVDEGLEAIAKALDVVQEQGERWWEAEILRLRGELLLKRNPPELADAQTSFQQAIEIARQQGAKSLELRATMSLARLLDKQGKRDQARAMLAEIYNWFTEGFDTADLRDAKALLDELAH